jgi:hypothetical protein
VLVGSKDRKVKFDKDDERLSVKAREAARKSAFNNSLQQPAGSANPPTVSPDIPDAVAKKLAELGIAGGTPMQVVSGDSAQAQAILAAFTQAGAPAAPTAEARLAQLKGLHDRGLLTNDEYAEQRQRILDQI